MPFKRAQRQARSERSALFTSLHMPADHHDDDDDGGGASFSFAYVKNVAWEGGGAGFDFWGCFVLNLKTTEPQWCRVL